MRSQEPKVPVNPTNYCMLWIVPKMMKNLLISHAVLARFNSNPGNKHVKANKQVIRYLKDVDDPNLGIRGTKSKDFDGIRSRSRHSLTVIGADVLTLAVLLLVTLCKLVMDQSRGSLRLQRP